MLRVLVRLGRAGIVSADGAWKLPVRTVMQLWDLRSDGKS